MNNRVFALYVTAILMALGILARAERPSTDEIAVRLGVDAWLQGRAAAVEKSALKPLYRKDLVAVESLSGATRIFEGWSGYVALWQPYLETVATFAARPAGDLKVSVQGDRAETNFSFASQGTYKDGRSLACGARVNLTWHRTDGVWQIAREELHPLDSDLSIDPARATTQR